MTTSLHVARLVSETKDGDGHWKTIIGVFSTKELANEAIENFVEGILNMEYPNVLVVSQSVDEFVLDQAINDQSSDEGSPLYPDEDPF